MVRVKKMPKAMDLTGQRFGMITVISIAKSEGRGTRWHCRCDCGNEKSIRSDKLRAGRIKSCGCYNNATRISRFVTHGQSDNDVFNIYHMMIYRCYNPNSKSFHDYGGRGITICQRWLDDINNFIEDMGPRPSVEHSIDRIDVNGNYEPNNCKWSTKKEQNRNRRKNKNNKSGIKGVYWDKRNKKWVATFRINNKHTRLGYFELKEEAAEARRKAEEEYWGESS